MKHLYALSVFFFLFIFLTFGQRPDMADFNLSGDAIKTGSNCIRLTADQRWAGGSIWHKLPIDLNQPFSIELKIMLGCKDREGADGIVFVFHPEARRTGYQGEGMGFAGLRPSLGIELDTWLNEHLGDPVEDHIALLANGQVQHYYSLAGPNPIRNIEDCREHDMRVRWSPGSQVLSIQLDGSQVLSYRGDIVGDIFGGDSRVYWGVTAATGNYSNRQEICFEKLEFTTIAPPKPLELDGPKGRELLRGEIIALNNLQFESGSATLLPDSRAELKKLAEIVRQRPKMQLEIFGHTDNVGGEGANLQLSERRARAVASHLQALGIPPKQLAPRGFGEQYPITSRRKLVDILAADLRCLDAHAPLGNYAFDDDPAKAVRHYEVG